MGGAPSPIYKSTARQVFQIETPPEIMIEQNSNVICAWELFAITSRPPFEDEWRSSLRSFLWGNRACPRQCCLANESHIASQRAKESRRKGLKVTL